MAFSIGLLTACTTTVQERAYDDYLEMAPANTFDPVTIDPRLKGMIAILSDFDENIIATTLDSVYADPLYFNDTFHTFRSRETLKQYFLKLSRQAETKVNFLDVSTFGNDAYVRWSMTIKFSVWWKDINVTSIGVTHVRFNDNDKIILHQDYWDGVEGFYAHLPMFGGVIKFIRSSLGTP